MKKKPKQQVKNPFHQKARKNTDEILSYPMRLNKYIAKTGICSRRKAVELIRSGQVEVNGKTNTTPYTLIQQEDKVTYRQKELKPETTFQYLLLNKPKNTITTSSDEHNRKTVLDLIDVPKNLRLFPIGRLDRNTTGLLLLTNDGDMAKKLSHPSHQVRKEYLIQLDKNLASEDLDLIRQGISLPDGPVEVKDLFFPRSPSRSWVTIVLTSGRNRIIRRLFEHLGYKVLKLDRIYFAGLTKKNLPRGKYRHLTPREIIMLKHFT